jgi:hypothetical protein
MAAASRVSASGNVWPVFCAVRIRSLSTLWCAVGCAVVVTLVARQRDCVLLCHRSCDLWNVNVLRYWTVVRFEFPKMGRLKGTYYSFHSYA